MVFSWVLWGCSSLKRAEKQTDQPAELTSQEKIKERKLKLKTMGSCINKLHNQLESQLKMSNLSEDEVRYAGEFLNVLMVNYESYLPDSAIIIDLKCIEQPFIIRVFGGNWCSDTHAGVPALYKVLDQIGLNAQRIEYIRVGRNKIPVDLSPANLDEGVGPVPLVIVMNHMGKEMGRIIEIPKESWEKDLLTILKSNGIR